MSYCPHHAKRGRRDAFGPAELLIIDGKTWPAVEDERRSRSRSRFKTNRAKLRVCTFSRRNQSSQFGSARDERMSAYLRGRRAASPQVCSVEPSAVDASFSFYPVGCGARLKTESVCGERRSNLSICSGDLFSVKGLKQMVHNKQRNIKR